MNHTTSLPARLKPLNHSRDCLFCLASGISIRALAENESDTGGCEVEILPLCHGGYAARSSGYLVEVRTEREEPGYDSCFAISVQWRATSGKTQEIHQSGHVLTARQDRLVKASNLHDRNRRSTFLDKKEVPRTDNTRPKSHPTKITSSATTAAFPSLMLTSTSSMSKVWSTTRNESPSRSSRMNPSSRACQK